MRGSQRNAVRIFVSAAAGHRASRGRRPPLLPSSTADHQSDQVSGAKTLALRELAQSASRANQQWVEKRKNAFEHAELPGACHKRTNCVEIV